MRRDQEAKTVRCWSPSSSCESLAVKDRRSGVEIKDVRIKSTADLVGGRPWMLVSCE